MQLLNGRKLTHVLAGNRITPSWVAFTDDERLVGDAAKNQFASNPHRTVFDIVSSPSAATWRPEY
jgi:molecular chaperone DnaK (HSP70)